MVSWRLRLDTSTNWAVSTTAILTVLTIGEPAVPHYFFAFVALANLAFLMIEARRYVIFLSSRARVRILEAGYYAATVLEDVEPEDSELSMLPSLLHRKPKHMGSVEVMDNWEAEIKRALLTPTRKHLSWPAFYVRLERNYVFLLFATYLGWIFKLATLDGGFRWEVFGSVTGVLLFLVAVIYANRPAGQTAYPENFIDSNSVQPPILSE